MYNLYAGDCSFNKDYTRISANYLAHVFLPKNMASIPPYKYRTKSKNLLQNKN